MEVIGNTFRSVAALACARYSLKNGRSTFTIIEFVVYAIIQFVCGYSYSLFLSAKLIQSWLWLFFNLSSKQRLSKLSCGLGFKSDIFQAGIEVDKNFNHYVFPRSSSPTTDEIDSVFGLKAQAIPQASYQTDVRPDVKLIQPTEYGFSVREDEILYALNSSGRCHNWAVHTIHHLSTDKFFSSTMLMILRWDVWILLAICLVIQLLFLVEGTPTKAVATAFDIGLLVLSLIDILNTRLELLKKTNMLQTQLSLRTEVTEFSKIMLLLLCWAGLAHAADTLKMPYFLQTVMVVPTSLVSLGLMRLLMRWFE